MPEIICYKCPHCGKIYYDRTTYREHVYDTLKECENTINSFYDDMKELKIGFIDNFDLYTSKKYYRVVSDEIKL